MRRKIESKILLASKRRTIFIFPARCWKPRDSFAVCLKRGGEKRRFYFERRNRGGRERRARNHEEFSRASIGSGTRKGKSREGEISLCDRCYPATLNPCHSRRRANIFHRRGPRFPQTWKLSLSPTCGACTKRISGGGNISGQKGDKRRTKREEETGGIWKSQERRGIIFIVRLMIVAARVDKKRG